MTITITGRKFTIKDSFREYAEKKMQKIERIFGSSAVARVTVTLERDRQTVELTIRQNGMLYRSEFTAAKMEDALDKTIDDIIRKMRKNKTRVEKKLRSGSLDTLELISDGEPPVAEEDIRIVRTKKFPIKPMDPEEAVLEMDMIGHQFYMFRDNATGEVNVVYRRKDGNYGLIEPEPDED